MQVNKVNHNPSFGGILQLSKCIENPKFMDPNFLNMEAEVSLVEEFPLIMEKIKEVNTSETFDKVVMNLINKLTNIAVGKQELYKKEAKMVRILMEKVLGKLPDDLQKDLFIFGKKEGDTIIIKNRNKCLIFAEPNDYEIVLKGIDFKTRWGVKSKDMEQLNKDYRNNKNALNKELANK